MGDIEWEEADDGLQQREGDRDMWMDRTGEREAR